MDSDSEKHVNIYPSGTIQNLQTKKCLTHFMEVLKSMQNLPTIFCPWHPRKAMSFLGLLGRIHIALHMCIHHNNDYFYNTANAEILKNQCNFKCSYQCIITSKGIYGYSAHNLYPDSLLPVHLNT